MEYGRRYGGRSGVGPSEDVSRGPIQPGMERQTDRNDDADAGRRDGGGITCPFNARERTVDYVASTCRMEMADGLWSGEMRLVYDDGEVSECVQ